MLWCDVIHRVLVKSNFAQVIPSTTDIKRLEIIFFYVDRARRARREASIDAPRLNFGPLSRRAAGCIDGHAFTYTTSNPDFFEFLVPLGAGHPDWVCAFPQRCIAAEKYWGHCRFA